MNFFEKILNTEKHEGVKHLHKDFTITRDKFWYFNRDFSVLEDRDLNMKAKTFFEDPSLLDHCEFLAKIGENQDPLVALPYICFAYGRNDEREALTAWAEKFPRAELIIGLDESGVIKDDSEIIPVSPKESDSERGE